MEATAGCCAGEWCESESERHVKQNAGTKQVMAAPLSYVDTSLVSHSNGSLPRDPGKEYVQ